MTLDNTYLAEEGNPKYSSIYELPIGVVDVQIFIAFEYLSPFWKKNSKQALRVIFSKIRIQKQIRNRSIESSFCHFQIPNTCNIRFKIVLGHWTNGTVVIVAGLSCCYIQPLGNFCKILPILVVERKMYRMHFRCNENQLR